MTTGTIYLSLSVQRNRRINYSDIIETLDSALVSHDNTERKSVNKTIIGKADYELPIGEKSKLEAGYRLMLIKMIITICRIRLQPIS
jgi:hypothetical protein